MFNCDNPNHIISDEGFSVQVLGRTGLRYQQGELWLRVDSEVLASPHGIAVFRSSIKKWEPDGQAIGGDEREKIIENIVRAFAFRNIEIETF